MNRAFDPRKILSVIALLLLGCTASGANGPACYYFSLPYASFGHLWNTSDGTWNGSPTPWCAATASMNSFQYLDNVSGIRRQAGADSVVSRNQLESMIGSSHTPQDIWNARGDWVTAHDRSAWVWGMAVGDLSGWRAFDIEHPLLSGYPTWDFLWNGLQRRQCALDLAFTLPDGSGHAVTLLSLSWDDNNGNAHLDSGESATIGYLDPNNPTQQFAAAVHYNGNSSLAFTWDNGGANDPAEVEMKYVFLAGNGEWNPLPEPSGMLVLLGGAGAVGAAMRRRKSV